MNRNTIDDPKLTAYALGELGARDRAEVERRLETDEAARRHVEETLAFAVQLGSALRAEAAPELRAAQLGAIRDAAKKKDKIIAFPTWLSRFAFPVAAAAGVVVAATLALPAFRHGGTASKAEFSDAAGATAPGEAVRAPASAPQAAAAGKVVAGQEVALLAPDGMTRGPLTQERAKEIEQVVQAAGIPGDARGVRGLAEAQPPQPVGVPSLERQDFSVSQSRVTESKPVWKERAEADRLAPNQERAAAPESRAAGGSTHRGALTLGIDTRSAAGGGFSREAAQLARPQGGGALGRNLGQLAMAEGGGAVAQSAPSPMASGKVFAFTEAAGAAAGASIGVAPPVAPPPPACPMPALGETLRAPGQPARPFDTETYDRIEDNPFLDAKQNPLSTFSIDVDTGSYSNLRRFLGGGQLPPAGAVRIEELLNYFEYDYPPAPEGKPFSVTVDVVEAPWNVKHRLARVGLKGREIDPANRPPCNLVFLLDVSGSMDQPNKLPLVKQAMKVLLEQLGEKDRVAIVTYAGASGLALPSTPADRKRDIREAIDELRAGGSTNGAAGIQLAYDIARANFIPGGANRVILATDGDFNIGVTSRDELLRLIEEKAKSGVFLTVLGFGMDNLKDATLEQLADKGNGTYGYIDDEREAKRLFARHATGSLVTIAKDVKIQVEFNPASVGAYRLIGYENRALRAEDFNDDKKDAGEIGSGHTVTALYELIPPGEDPGLPKVDELKYQHAPKPTAKADELMTVKLRYKKPDGDTSDKIEAPVRDGGGSMAAASTDLKFAAAVAEFGMLLRNSPHKGTADWKGALELAAAGRGADAHGDRAEFIDLIRAAEKLNDQR